MYALLELYARPHDPQAPVICVDEKSKQLLEQTRRTLPAQPGAVAQEDYEYVRAGTCNIFVAVEPQGGRRHTTVTARRAKPDFVAFICGLLDTVYARVQKIHLVVDNLNTHFAHCFEEVLGPQTAALVLARLEFHYTACQLAEYGGVGNWNYGKAMHRTTLGQLPDRGGGTGRVATTTQR